MFWLLRTFLISLTLFPLEVTLAPCISTTASIGPTALAASCGEVACLPAVIALLTSP